MHSRQLQKESVNIDKRPNIAGNVYTEDMEKVHVHKYRTHFSIQTIKKYGIISQKLQNLIVFTNSPVANYKGELYSLPFNMYTFNKM